MRSIAKLMQDWQFTGPDGKTTLVELPHTWNAKDGQDGGNDYWRGTCTYSTTFAAPVFDAASQEVWLQFEGVNSSAKVLLNGRNICTHDGGYSTFRVHVSDLLAKDNQLTVEVDNSVNDRVYPQKADFTFYGGIYRDISLMVVSKTTSRWATSATPASRSPPPSRTAGLTSGSRPSWKARALSPSSCRTQPAASWSELRAQTLSSTSTLPTSGTA